MLPPELETAPGGPPTIVERLPTVEASLVNARRFRLAMTHSSRTFVRSEVSTKSGQVQGLLKSGTRDADGTNSRRGRLDRPGLLADLHGVGAAASRPEPWMTEVATDDKQPSPDGLDAGAATLIGA